MAHYHVFLFVRVWLRNPFQKYFHFKILEEKNKNHSQILSCPEETETLFLQKNSTQFTTYSSNLKRDNVKNFYFLHVLKEVFLKVR